ncbi:Uncharacterised protein [Serratia marcescens]|nr:hypothetical protein DP21_4533 [Serratia marcescens]CAI2016754.1 Uncharacterised protein [Serratia marcescens]
MPRAIDAAASPLGLLARKEPACEAMPATFTACASSCGAAVFLPDASPVARTAGTSSSSPGCRWSKPCANVRNWFILRNSAMLIPNFRATEAVVSPAAKVYIWVFATVLLPLSRRKPPAAAIVGVNATASGKHACMPMFTQVSALSRREKTPAWPVCLFFIVFTDDESKIVRGFRSPETPRLFALLCNVRNVDHAAGVGDTTAQTSPPWSSANLTVAPPITRHRHKAPIPDGASPWLPHDAESPASWAIHGHHGPALSAGAARVELNN